MGDKFSVSRPPRRWAGRPRAEQLERRRLLSVAGVDFSYYQGTWSGPAELRGADAGQDGADAQLRFVDPQPGRELRVRVDRDPVGRHGRGVHVLDDVLRRQRAAGRRHPRGQQRRPARRGRAVGHGDAGGRAARGHGRVLRRHRRAGADGQLPGAGGRQAGHPRRRAERVGPGRGGRRQLRGRRERDGQRHGRHPSRPSTPPPTAARSTWDGRARPTCSAAG